MMRSRLPLLSASFSQGPRSAIKMNRSRSRLSVSSSDRNANITNQPSVMMFSLLSSSDADSGAVLDKQTKLTSHPPKAWQADSNINIQRVTQQAMIHELTKEQTQTIETVVPWFLATMPQPYFHQVPDSMRLDHIKAIAAVKEASMDLYLNLKSRTPDGREVLTFIRPSSSPGLLFTMVAEELPYTIRSNEENFLPLTRAQVFSAEDESMSLNIFVYGEEKSGPIDIETSGARILDYAEAIQTSSHLERESLMEYMRKCSLAYIENTDPRRFLLQKELFELVSGTEGTAMVVEDSSSEGLWVNVATSNSLPQNTLENVARLMYVHNLDVVGAHLDLIPDGDNGTVTMIRMRVAPVPGKIVDETTFKLMEREIKRSKWLDLTTMHLVFDQYPWLGVRRGEIITAFCSLMHPVMAKRNAFVYSKRNIINIVTKERYISHASSIATLFLDRFNPNNPLPNEAFEEKCEELRSRIDSDVEDTTASELLLKMIDIVTFTLKTNIYLHDRYSLGLRLDPRVMMVEGDDSDHRELPYGIIFAHGRRFNAYHIRFRDISRGGMRLVTPLDPEQYAFESAHHYDECYELAFAQQLKNKDIPEGGSKAVNLIDVIGLSPSGKEFVMRKSVKAFTDTLLDLIVDTKDTRENIVDLFARKEILYLGPDEQVIPEDINWIIQRAKKRGYDTPAAFMSSKPRAGINHKEYGVTSEGVNVYLDVALRYIGIDPTKQSFTLKMTGGPDGDVAGNEIKILIREYGENAKIVGVADHSGCAEDPNGLNHSELLRLVNSSMSIGNFDPTKLGPDGVLHTVDNEEGVKARNSMHNRLEADAFVPAGGRPNTIDIHNYRHFLKEDGSPSAPLIVEGANLFVTAEARQALFEDAGVAIVKDSSANKGGVITSSYEICAAMLLSEDEFFENKEEIVNEVLAKLRGMANLEAKLLFREFETFGGSLPHCSQVISDTINTATDALSMSLDTLSEEDIEALLPLFRAHLPKTLADMSFDFVHERVPMQYIKNAIASCLASKLVYKEGTKFIAVQSTDKLAEIALEYLKKEKEITALKECLVDANIPETEKQEIIALLDAGGARTALGIF